MSRQMAVQTLCVDIMTRRRISYLKLYDKGVARCAGMQLYPQPNVVEKIICKI
jgi:hypothetical protein